MYFWGIRGHKICQIYFNTELSYEDLLIVFQGIKLKNATVGSQEELLRKE
jgi:hypothetical protein